MSIRPLLSLLALAGVGAAAAAQESRPARSAKAFQLESLAPAPTPAPTPALPPPSVPDSAAVTAPPEPVASPSPRATPTALPAVRGAFTLDTPIADLIADPAARAVLDRNLPGLSNDDNLDKFATLSLRQFQPMTGGQLTDAMLGKVAGDLSKLGGALVVPVAPTTAPAPSKRNRDASR